MQNAGEIRLWGRLNSYIYGLNSNIAETPLDQSTNASAAHHKNHKPMQRIQYISYFEARCAKIFLLSSTFFSQ